MQQARLLKMESELKVIREQSDYRGNTAVESKRDSSKVFVKPKKQEPMRNSTSSMWMQASEI
jgi:hypothetical protein